ncbi:MAG TPA: ferritin [Lentisphaeria bacterium]|nr:MAG: ferritin [Lentisphaerae bacterium GWF2_49_21]HBC88289.1 ferritin [Lentisphaeria bacterium]
MIPKKIEAILNDQLSFELYSAYIYLAMAAHLKFMGLNGFANWMKVQAQEETVHGMGFYTFIIDRGGKVELKAVPQPKSDWKSALVAFEGALEHECLVTSRINKIAALAEAEKDFATKNFIQWYIGEQVEEEANATEIINELKLASNSREALLMLDREKAMRAFVFPVIPGGLKAPGAAAP